MVGRRDELADGTGSGGVLPLVVGGAERLVGVGGGARLDVAGRHRVELGRRGDVQGGAGAPVERRRAERAGRHLKHRFTTPERKI